MSFLEYSKTTGGGGLINNLPQTEKQTAITNAQAQAESVKIKAEAEAEANRVLSQSLTQQIIEYNKIQKWNGTLPQVTDGNAIIDLR